MEVKIINKIIKILFGVAIASLFAVLPETVEASYTNQPVTIRVSSDDSLSGVRYLDLPNGNRLSYGTSSQGAASIQRDYVVTRNGNYSFTATDVAGNTRSHTQSVTQIDTTAPTGTVSGNPSSWTNQNVTLTFTATDTGGSGMRRVRRPNGTWVSGSSTSQSVSSNGTYTFVAEDNAGNTRNVSVTVNRIDKSRPTGSITGNPTNWTNQNATLSFSATDTGGSGVRRVRRPNGTWVNGSSTTQTVSSNGTYTFRVEDHAGNIRDVSTTVNRIDKSAPSGTISGNPVNWTNQDVMLSFSATDTGGSGVRRVRRPNGTWVSGSSATHTVGSNGTYTFRVEDHAGNVRDVSAHVNRIDKINPNGSISGNPTSWINTDVTLTLNATDSGGSGVRRVRRPNGTWVNSSTATHTVSSNGTYTFRVEDHAGNIHDISTSVNRIDKTLPNGTVTGNPTSWTNQNATLSFNATDAGGSGVRRVRTPSGTWVNGPSVQFTATSNGTYTFRVEDHAGNTRDVTSIVNRIDKIAPSGAISGNPTSWTNENVTLTINATDAGGSNVRRIRRPDGTWANGSSTTHTVTSNGAYAFLVEDHAGNRRNISVVVNRIDKERPTGTIDGNPLQWTNQDVVLSFSASDTGGSGVRRIRRPNGTWTESTYTTDVIKSNGTYTFRVEDHAGNTRDVSIDVTRIDKLAPAESLIDISQ